MLRWNFTFLIDNIWVVTNTTELCDYNPDIHNTWPAEAFNLLYTAKNLTNLIDSIDTKGKILISAIGHT